MIIAVCINFLAAVLHSGNPASGSEDQSRGSCIAAPQIIGRTSEDSLAFDTCSNRHDATQGASSGHFYKALTVPTSIKRRRQRQLLDVAIQGPLIIEYLQHARSRGVVFHYLIFCT